MGWGHLTWPGDLNLRDMGLNFSQHVRKRCMIRCARNGGLRTAVFVKIWKNRGGFSTTPPPPAGRRLIALQAFTSLESVADHAQNSCHGTAPNCDGWGWFGTVPWGGISADSRRCGRAISIYTPSDCWPGRPPLRQNPDANLLWLGTNWALRTTTSCPGEVKQQE